MNQTLGQLTYRTIQFLRREPITQALAELEKSQAMSQSDLLALQWERLQKLLKHAYAIPFYRERMDQAGLPPSKIKDPRDYARLPPLTKTDIRKHGPALRSTSVNGPVSVVSTSGSTGFPLSIARSRASTAYARAAMYRAHHWHGLRVGDRELRFWGEPAEQKSHYQEKLKDILMNRDRLSAFDLRWEQMKAFYQEIRRQKPRYLFGYSTILDHFTRVAVSEGWDLQGLGLRCVKATSEPLRPGQSERMEKAFGCSVLNEYGCTESGIVSVSCRFGGLHTSPETLYLELEAIPDSPWRRVLVTDLHNEAMPLLRYELGDLAESASAETCACGSTLPLMGAVLGRQTSIIEISGGRKVHSLVLYYTLLELEKKGSAIRQARLIQGSPSDFVCQVVSETGPTPQESQWLLQSLSRHFGDQAKIQVERVPSIPPSASGKNSDFVKAF